jgi:phenylalanyl-tRNA synthetase beta chain
MFEIDAAALQARTVPAYKEISKFPAMVRDIALVVKQSVAMQDLMNVFTEEKHKNSACHILQAVVLFDEYRGKGLEKDEKSLAFRFTLQDTQTTLQDEVVEAAMAAFILAASKNFGAKLRT